MTHPLHAFRFCPRCGSARFEPHDARSKRCAGCGFTFYLNASAATAAFIFDRRGRLLAVRRAKDPARGTLDLPGGFVDAGESLTEGLEREIREELGAGVAEAEFLFSLPNRYPYGGMDVPTADAFFRVRLAPGDEPAAGDDAAELVWLAPGEVRPEAFGLESVRRAVGRYMALRPQAESPRVCHDAGDDTTVPSESTSTPTCEPL